MRNIFSDSKLENEISEIGYVVFPSLVSEDVCSELTEFYLQNSVPDERNFSISNWNNNLESRYEIWKKIVAKLQPFADEILDKYKPVMGVFTVKKSGKNSDMLIHQDWSLVDERKFRSVSVWVALCDMDQNNGNLQLAPKSHLYCPFPRGMNTPIAFESIRHEMPLFLKDVPLKKGDAIVFEHKVIHASPANFSGKDRIAAVLALIPEEAPLVHYYQPIHEKGYLELLSINDEQFHLFDFFDIPNRPPNNGLIKKFKYRFPILSKNDIVKILD